jgi:acetolactate synthase I/II/III large subunit
MTVAEFVAAALAKQGVEQIFFMIGGMITRLADAMHRSGALRMVPMLHEQAAAFAAEAAARMTDNIGVAMATSGPGATNLLTGIASCWFDSVPAIFITGQVNRNELKGDRGIRQLGFQETDIVAMARPVTKAAWLLDDPQAVPERLAAAVGLALSERRGPVLLDIPMDVQAASLPQAERALERFPLRPAPLPFHDLAAIDALLDTLVDAKRPLFLAGGGLRSAGATSLFQDFLHLVRVPTVVSLMGQDCLPADQEQRVGFIGSYGNRWANYALARCDVLVVCGSRLDIRQTGKDTETFVCGKRIWQIDCDPGEPGVRVAPQRIIVADLASFLTTALARIKARHFKYAAPPAWYERIAAWRAAWPDTDELPTAGVHPNVFLHALSACSRHAAAVVSDVGNNQMWTAQSFDLAPGQRHLTSGGLGSMGFALPAALGAALASGRPTVAVAGDGGFQCNIQELAVIAGQRLPVKMIVLNNQCLGMVRGFQEAYFEGRYVGTVWGYDAPNFSDVAAAYGVATATLADPARIREALERLWRDPEEPFLLQVRLDTSLGVAPKMTFGQPLDRMDPPRDYPD